MAWITRSKYLKNKKHICAQNLAEVCKEYSTVLLHISTDFVFEGVKEQSLASCIKPKAKVLLTLKLRFGRQFRIIF